MKRPNAPAIAYVPRTLRLTIADRGAVFVVLANRETSWRSNMMVSVGENDGKEVLVLQ